MDMNSKLTINLTASDMEALLSTAVVGMLKDKYAMSITPDQISKIRFNATLDYGQMDRGPGTPKFSGATIEIAQSTTGVKHETR